jgi:hypothetical protein
MTKITTIDKIQDTYIIYCINCGSKFLSENESPPISSTYSECIRDIQNIIERLDHVSSTWVRIDVIRKYISKNIDKPMLIHLFREIALSRGIKEANFQRENGGKIIFNTDQEEKLVWDYDNTQFEKAVI